MSLISQSRVAPVASPVLVIEKPSGRRRHVVAATRPRTLVSSASSSSSSSQQHRRLASAGRHCSAASLVGLLLARSWRSRRSRQLLQRLQGPGIATATDEAAKAAKKPVRARRRPQRATMSVRTALEEPPSIEYLDACLAAGRLEQADQVTRDLILTLSGEGALARGFALASEVTAISAEEMRRIDDTWLRHTNGKQGYSVQHRLWNEASENQSRFMQKVGWVVRDADSGKDLRKFWPRREFDYSEAAPQGHLPLTNMIRGKDLLLALLNHSAWGQSADTEMQQQSAKAASASVDSIQAWWAEIAGLGEGAEEKDEASASSTASSSGSDSLEDALKAFDGESPADLPAPQISQSPRAKLQGKTSDASGSASFFDGIGEWASGLLQGSATTPQRPRKATKSSLETGPDDEAGLPYVFQSREPSFRITLITGFETFNARLYSEAATLALAGCDDLQVCVFTDKDLDSRRGLVERALAETDVVFCSLLFDYDQAEWLQSRIDDVPVRFVFESALELMSCTSVGSFQMASSGGGSKGMPPEVRAMISKLTGTREEDRIAGYTKFLKTGPRVLKFLPPIGPLPDLRRWLQTYAYWSGGGVSNVAKMLRYIAREFGDLQVDFDDLLSEEEEAGGESTEPEVVEIPQVGLLHPSRKYVNEPGPFFSTPKEYMEWYRHYRPEAIEEGWPVCAILLFRKHVISELAYIPQLINYFEEKKLLPLPLFIQGVDAHIAVRDLLTSREEVEATAAGHRPTNPTLSEGAVEVDCVVNTIGFSLVGGPAGSMEGGRSAEIAMDILSSLNVPYTVAAPLLIQDVASWREQGIGGLQGVVLYALPELDGAIDTVPLGGLLKKSGDIELLPDRAERLTERLQKWVKLRAKRKASRKVAIVLYGYPPGLGAAGTAALLNVPKSLQKLLKAMQAEGYDVGDLPDDPEEILRMVRDADAAADSGQSYGNAKEEGAGAVNVPVQSLAEWLPKWSQEAVENKWGEGLTKSGLRTLGDQLLLGGRRFGNVWIAVQPPLGIPGDPMRLLFERDMTPHPQYVAFYKYLEKDFGADAVVHFGMHGTAEWLPGRPLGNMAACWPDQLLGSIPNVYLYAANNPSESILAKRRGYGSLVSHNVPPYARAGLYRELQTLRGLLGELIEQGSAEGGAENLASAAAGAGAAPMAASSSSSEAGGGVKLVEPAGSGAPSLEGAVVQAVLAAGLDQDLPFSSAVQSALDSADPNDDEARAEAAASVLMSPPDGEESFSDYAGRLRAYLAELEATLFSSGLHTLGDAPGPAELKAYLSAYFDGQGREQLPNKMLDALSEGHTLQKVLSSCPTATAGERKAAEEAVQLRELLGKNTEELEGMLRALNGEFLLPAPGGDLLRDGPGVLPTGRNIHALDPYRIPGATALARGVAIAEATLEQQLQQEGCYPETIAVNLWGLEAIKTKGESVAVVLGLVGARPVSEATGRVARYELIPLEELKRPRVDALCSLSGIFRDSFSNVVELLDDVLRRAAEADEPPEMNYVRKHFLEMQETEGSDGASSRIFSNAAGEFGSLVNERVSAGNWDETEELGETWAQRNAFAFGRSQRGVQRRGVLDKLLSTSGSVVQLTDSLEYGLTDIQEYYANTGAMVRKMGDLQNRKVDALVVETTQRKIKPKKLDSALRMEYRTKLLNPKWAEAMVAQGSGGAFEVSQRMTALLGWGATTTFKENWVWDQGVQQYILNEDIAQQLRESNPEAFRNIIGRCLEASARGLWEADEKLLEDLQEKYDDLGDELEGMMM
mmetsp:Transcript_2978/g.6554  ORF Transcript_2978/g.6554 Transcript_2978/m.6554 type:complete len:1763 (+) Transcript_2978:74-5362(+)